MDAYNRRNETAAADGDTGGGSGSAYNAYVMCASAGNAAVALGGTTVHAAFKLARSGGNKRGGMDVGDEGLSHSDLNMFRVALRRARYVIVDEVSMMSADPLRDVDCRLRRITQRVNEPKRAARSAAASARGRGGRRRPPVELRRQTRRIRRLHRRLRRLPSRPPRRRRSP